MKYIIADANVIVAHFDSSDIWHGKTQQILVSLEKKDNVIVHLDFILSEAISVLARRFEQKGLPRMMEPLLNEIERNIPHESIAWISQYAEEWYSEILGIIKNTQGKLNFNDAFIAVFMRKFVMTHLFSFDRDFDLMPHIIRISDQTELSAI